MATKRTQQPGLLAIRIRGDLWMLNSNQHFETTARSVEIWQTEPRLRLLGFHRTSIQKIAGEMTAEPKETK